MGNLAITRRYIAPDGLAARDPRLVVGLQLIEVNGVDVMSLRSVVACGVTACARRAHAVCLCSAHAHLLHACCLLSRSLG